MATLSDLGEFNFIERIARLISASPQVIEGIGDDCAVLAIGDRLLLVSCDLSIENIHFRRSAATPEDIGWKAAASALSDIAAMGGQPLFALVALAAPPDTDPAELEALFQGMVEATEHCNAIIVGGDTTRSENGITIDVTVIGEAPQGRYLTRKGAQPGDLLVITGSPGLSAAGLHAQAGGQETPALHRAHYHPLPRVREGQWLCKNDAIHALIDTSDGLTQDAGHIAERSGLGIEITSAKLPIDNHLSEYCARHNLDPFPLALTGGEDYELAFALDKEQADEILQAFQGEFSLNATIVGEFTQAFQGVRVDGRSPRLTGFDHFGSLGAID